MTKKQFRLVYSKEFSKQFACLDKSVKVRVLKELIVLESNPLAGKSLTGDLRGRLSFRVGNYRVIYRIIDFDINIVTISHRKKVYDK